MYHQISISISLQEHFLEYLAGFCNKLVRILIIRPWNDIAVVCLPTFPLINKRSKDCIQRMYTNCLWFLDTAFIIFYKSLHTVVHEAVSSEVTPECLRLCRGSTHLSSTPSPPDSPLSRNKKYDDRKSLWISRNMETQIELPRENLTIHILPRRALARAGVLLIHILQIGQ